MASAFNLTAQINLRGPDNLKPIVSQIRRELGSINANVNVKLDPRGAKSVELVSNRLSAMNNILTQTKANVVSLNQALRDLSGSLSSVQATSNTSASGVAKAAKNIDGVAKSIKVARTEMEEFGKQSALAVRRFAAFSVVTSAVFGLTNAITSGFKAFITFDRELVKLQQVTGKGAIGIKSLENEITRLATTLGVSSESLMTVASTLAQAGLNANETRIALAALAKTELAPSFDNLTETTEGAIAALRQFGLQAQDLEAVLGSINAVAAAFAVESRDIITAIQRTGGVFASASKGVSQGKDALNEFIAVFTSVRATTRESAETIATGLRTIFTRIQRAGTIKQLKEFGVELQDLEGKFVGPFEAVKRLSEALLKLDPRDIRFATIVEELGGFRQIGKVIPLIQQFATTQQALGVAQKGQSSLTDAQIKAQQSLANQIAKVREQFLALIRDIGQSTVFQGLFKIVLGLTSGFLSLASAFKPILPILAVFTAIKGVSAIGQFATGFFGGLRKGGGAGGAGQNIGESLSGAKEKQRAEVTAKAADAIRANTDALKTLTSAVTNLTNAINKKGGSTFNDGGKVLGFNKGGIVPGYGGGDKVPALLEPGEVIINNKAANKYGRGNLVRMNKYAGGGEIFTKQIPGALKGMKDTQPIGYNDISKLKINNSGKGSIRGYFFENFVNKEFGVDAPENKFPDIPNLNVKKGLKEKLGLTKSQTGRDFKAAELKYRSGIKPEFDSQYTPKNTAVLYAINKNIGGRIQNFKDAGLVEEEYYGQKEVEAAKAARKALKKTIERMFVDKKGRASFAVKRSVSMSENVSQADREQFTKEGRIVSNPVTKLEELLTEKIVRTQATVTTKSPQTKKKRGIDARLLRNLAKTGIQSDDKQIIEDAEKAIKSMSPEQIKRLLMGDLKRAPEGEYLKKEAEYELDPEFRKITGLDTGVSGGAVKQFEALAKENVTKGIFERASYLDRIPDALGQIKTFKVDLVKQLAQEKDIKIQKSLQQQISKANTAIDVIENKRGTPQLPGQVTALSWAVRQAIPGAKELASGGLIQKFGEGTKGLHGVEPISINSMSQNILNKLAEVGGSRRARELLTLDKIKARINTVKTTGKMPSASDVFDKRFLQSADATPFLSTLSSLADEAVELYSGTTAADFELTQEQIAAARDVAIAGFQSDMKDLGSYYRLRKGVPLHVHTGIIAPDKYPIIDRLLEKQHMAQVEAAQEFAPNEKITPLKKEDRQKFGEANLGGYNLEAILALLGSGNGKKTTQDAIDFANGLTPLAAGVFGVPPGIPTQAKLSVTSSNVTKALDGIIKTFAFGGKADGSEFEKIKKQIMDKYPQIDFRISKRKKAFGYMAQAGLMGGQRTKVDFASNLQNLISVTDKMASSLIEPQTLADGGFVKSALAKSEKTITWGKGPNAPTTTTIDPRAVSLFSQKSTVDTIEQELSKLGIGSLKFIGSGKDSLAYDAGDNIVKFSPGGLKKYSSNIPEQLKPSFAKLIEGYGVEVMPKVNTNVTESDLEQLKKIIISKGYQWGDAALDNMGKLGDRLVVIDGDIVPLKMPSPPLPSKKFTGGGPVTLYHGSNTGVNDNVLKSFQEKGGLSNIATGYGQGAGLYVYSGKEKAKQQAMMRVGKTSGSMAVVSGDTAGKPMVVTFKEMLDPETWDLDYELNKGSVVKWLTENYDKVKQLSELEDSPVKVIEKIEQDRSQGIMSSGIRVQTLDRQMMSDSGEMMTIKGGSRKSIYSGTGGDIREGELVGQLMGHLQTKDPKWVHAFENEFFSSPFLSSGDWDNLALKYTGSAPLKPTNIETFASGGTVPAMVSKGEAFVPPALAKKIGYGKLHKMNQADRNGMRGFAGGGISVFKGPGSGTSDSIGPIGLPQGSFIIREKATKALGLHKNGSSKKYRSGGYVKKVDGGPIINQDVGNLINQEFLFLSDELDGFIKEITSGKASFNGVIDGLEKLANSLSPAADEARLLADKLKQDRDYISGKAEAPNQAPGMMDSAGRPVNASAARAKTYEKAREQENRRVFQNTQAPGRLSKEERKRRKEEFTTQQRGGITRKEARAVGATRSDFGGETVEDKGLMDARKVALEKYKSKAAKTLGVSVGDVESAGITQDLERKREGMVSASASRNLRTTIPNTQVMTSKADASASFSKQVISEVKAKYQALFDEEKALLKSVYTEKAKQAQAEGKDVSGILKEYQDAVSKAKRQMEGGVKNEVAARSQELGPGTKPSTAIQERVDQFRENQATQAKADAEAKAAAQEAKDRAADPFYDVKKSLNTSTDSGLPKVNPKIAAEQNKYMEMRAERAGLSVGGYKYSLAQKLGQNKFNVEREMTLARADTQTMVTGRRRELAGVNISGALKAAEGGDTSQEVQRVQSVISDFTSQLQKANPALTFQQARDAAIDLATKVSEGKQSFEEIVATNETLKTSLGDTVDASVVLAESLRRTSVETGESIENLKANVSQRAVQQQQFLSSKEGKSFGMLGQLAPGAAQALSKTRVGKGLIAGGQFVSGQGGALSKAFAGAGGFTGIGTSLTVGAESLKQLLPKTMTSDPNTAGALGALGGAGSGAAMGAQLGSFAGPIGTLIGGVGGAIIGGLQGWFSAKNQAVLTNALENIAKTSGDLDEAFKKLESDSSQVNFDNAQKAFGDVVNAGKDIEELAFSKTGFQSLGDTFTGGVDKFNAGFAQGDISKIVLGGLQTAFGASGGGLLVDYFSAPSEAQRTEAIGAMVGGAGQKQEAATRLAETQLKTKSADEIAAILDNIKNGTGELNPIVDQYVQGALKAAEAANDTQQLTAAQEEAITVQAKERAALDAYMKKRKESGATDEQIAKELSKNRGAAIKEGEAAIKVQAEVTAKQALLAKTMKEVTIVSENLADVYRRITAYAQKYSDELDRFSQDVDSMVAGLGGDIGMRTVDRKNEQVLGNVSAYSMEEVKAASAAAAGFMGGTPEAQNLANQAVGQKIVLDQIPNLLRNASTPEAREQALSQIEQLLKDQGIDGEGIKVVLQDLKNKLTQEGGATASEVQEQVQKSFETIGNGAEALQTVIKKYNDTLQLARKYQQDYNKAILEAGSYMRKAGQVRLNAELDLAKALGRSPTLEELNKPFDVEVNALTSRLVGTGDLAAGAASDPMAIAAAITSAEKRKGEIERTNPDLFPAGAGIPAGPAGDPMREKLNQEQLANIQAVGELTVASNEGRQALEKLANDGTKAANALSKIQEQQQAMEGFGNFAQKVFTAEPQELARMELNAAALNAAEQGGPNFMKSRRNRQQAFAGLEQKREFMLPEEYRKERAQLIRQSFESQGKRGGDVVTTIGGKDITLDELTKRLEGGVDETDPNVIEFRKATEIQAKANEALGMLNVEQAMIIERAMVRLEEFFKTDFPNIIAKGNADAQEANKPPVMPEPKEKKPSTTEEELKRAKTERDARADEEKKAKADAAKAGGIGFGPGAGRAIEAQRAKNKAKAASEAKKAADANVTNLEAKVKAEQEAAVKEEKAQQEQQAAAAEAAKVKQKEAEKAKSQETIERTKRTREGGRSVMVAGTGRLPPDVVAQRYGQAQAQAQQATAPQVSTQQAAAQPVDTFTQQLYGGLARTSEEELARMGSSKSSKEKEIAKKEKRLKYARVAAYGREGGPETSPNVQKAQAELDMAKADMENLKQQIAAEEQKLAAYKAKAEGKLTPAATDISGTNNARAQAFAGLEQQKNMMLPSEYNEQKAQLIKQGFESQGYKGTDTVAQIDGKDTTLDELIKRIGGGEDKNNEIANAALDKLSSEGIAATQALQSPLDLVAAMATAALQSGSIYTHDQTLAEQLGVLNETITAFTALPTGDPGFIVSDIKVLEALNNMQAPLAVLEQMAAAAIAEGITTKDVTLSQIAATITPAINMVSTGIDTLLAPINAITGVLAPILDTIAGPIKGIASYFGVKLDDNQARGIAGGLATGGIPGAVRGYVAGSVIDAASQPQQNIPNRTELAANNANGRIVSAPVPVTRPTQTTTTTQPRPEQTQNVEGSLLTLNPDSLEQLNTFNTNFASYVDKLVAFEFPRIPDKIEMTGNHTVDVRISGAAAFEGLKKDFENMMQKEIGKAMGKLWGQSGGQFGTRPPGEGAPQN